MHQPFTENSDKFSARKVWESAKRGVMSKFLTNPEAQQVITLAASEIGNRSAVPASEAIAEGEKILAMTKERREAHQPPVKPEVKAAAKALYEAALAKAEAKAAQERAKAAVAAVPVLGKGKQETPPAMPQGLNTVERREWVKKYSTFSQETARFFTDGYLMQAATHACSDPTLRPVAMNELTRRGYIHHAATGIFTRSA